MSARILIVDDEPAIRRLARAALERAGLVCEAAKDAIDAAACLERARFDLVLTDVDMPGVSGLALARAIRCGRPALPVLVMSGGAYEREAAQLGACAFLPKPFSPATVVEAVTASLALEPSSTQLALSRT